MPDRVNETHPKTYSGEFFRFFSHKTPIHMTARVLVMGPLIVFVAIFVTV